MVINDSEFPLLVVEFTSPFTDDDALAFGNAMRELLVRKQEHAIVFHPQGLTTMSSSQRAKIAAMAKETEAESATYVVCACVVIDNALARGVITAINWVAPPKFEQRFMKTLAEAKAHARARLLARGLNVRFA